MEKEYERNKAHPFFASKCAYLGTVASLPKEELELNLWFPEQCSQRESVAKRSLQNSPDGCSSGKWQFLAHEKAARQKR